MRMQACLWMVLAATVVAGPGAWADPPIVNGDFAQGMTGWYFHRNDGRGEASVVASETSETGIAFRAEIVREDEDTNWAVFMHQRLLVPVERGDRVELRVVARSDNAASLAMFLEDTERHHIKLCGDDQTLTEGFRLYTFRGTAREDWAAGDATVALHFSRRRGVVEIALIEVTVDRDTSRLNEAEPLPEPLVLDTSVVLEGGEALDGWSASAGATLESVATEHGPAAVATPGESGGGVTLTRVGGEAIWLEQQATLRLWLQGPPAEPVVVRLMSEAGVELMRYECLGTSSWRLHEAVAVVDEAAEAGAWSVVVESPGAVAAAGVRVQATDDY